MSCRRFLSRHFFLLGALLLSSASVVGKSYPASLMSWVNASDLIFEGVVEKVGETTEPRVADKASSMAVTQVTRNFFGKGRLGSYDGKLTIAWPHQPPVREGKRYIFFCQGWILGRTPVVVALAHLPASAYPHMGEAVQKIQSYFAHNKLYERLKHSAAVVIASVGKTKIVSDIIGSMHSAIWAEASLSVETWLAGKTAKEIRVRFDESQDIAHIEEPKLVEGERVILLLQKDDAGRYVVIDPLDRQELDKEDGLRDLIAHPPPSPVAE